MDVASGLNKAVHFRAATQVNDFLPMSRRDMTALEGCARAWRASFEAAGMTLEDLDLVETHDCFTIAELMQYEAMGLTAPGRGAEAALERLDAQGRTIACQCVGRTQGERSPHWCDWSVDARVSCDAVMR